MKEILRKYFKNIKFYDRLVSHDYLLLDIKTETSSTWKCKECNTIICFINVLSPILYHYLHNYDKSDKSYKGYVTLTKFDTYSGYNFRDPEKEILFCNEYIIKNII